MSFARRSQRDQGLSERPGAPARVGRSQQAAAVLRLQHSLGNRGTRALLRSPDESAPLFAPLTSAFTKGGLDAATWRQKVDDAKRARNQDDAKSLYIELYQDLARTAGADVVPDVSPKYPINVAAGDDTSYKPGLNLVLGPGGATGGSTAFVDASGKFGATLSLTTGTTQHVAIRLFSDSFHADKPMSLDILRHEMTHAKHLQRAQESAAKWLKAGGKGGADKFAEWLKANRKGLSDADVVLIRETARGLSANTEALAYVEGFINAFHLIDPPPPVDHPVFLELLGVLETRKVLPWKSADNSVRDLAVKRLAKYREKLDKDHRQALDAWVQAQAKRVHEDEAALKAKSDPGKVAGAHARQQNAFAEFIKRLQSIVGK